MKYLVTGGAGFIGSHVSDRLISSGNEVVVVDNFNTYYNPQIKEENIKAHLKNPHYSLYRLDIEESESLKNVFKNHTFDGVIHLAARAGVRPSVECPTNYIKTNLLGTVNLLECMKEFNVKKLIMASSSSVYGNCKANQFSEFLEIDQPISPYAATKSACEQFCYTWHYLYGINVVLLRFFTVYGPRQRPDLAIHKFAKKILQGDTIQIYGDENMRRDYTYIDDIVDGIEKSIGYNQTGYEIINLGGGHPVSIREMITILEKVLDKKAIVEIVDKQLGDVDKTICDNQKASCLLGYSPKTSFNQGIQEFVKWLKKTNF